MLLYALRTLKGTLFFPYQGFLMRSPNKSYLKTMLAIYCANNRVHNELPLGKTPRVGTIGFITNQGS